MDELFLSVHLENFYHTAVEILLDGPADEIRIGGHEDAAKVLHRHFLDTYVRLLKKLSGNLHSFLPSDHLNFVVEDFGEAL